MGGLIEMANDAVVDAVGDFAQEMHQFFDRGVGLERRVDVESDLPVLLGRARFGAGRRRFWPWLGTDAVVDGLVALLAGGMAVAFS